MSSASIVAIGEVELPSGVLALIDPGLGRFWRHDLPPLSPRRGAPPVYDLAIVGPDADAAGRKYNRQFTPRHLYDSPDPARTSAHFADFCRTEGFSAQAQPTAGVPHLERAREALRAGDGLGVVAFNGVWGVVASGLPAGRRLPVVGLLHDAAGEFADRFRSIDVVIDAAAVVARSRTVQGVMVEHGQLLFCGLEPLGAFRMWESLDGLADYVFRGRDAAALAAQVGARDLDGGRLFGWTDLPMDAVEPHAMEVQRRAAQQRLAVSVDYRPHCNLERLNAQVRTSAARTGSLTLDGALACGCDNRWGDGIYDVIADYDAGGRVVRIRVDVGNEQTQRRLRALGLMGKLAVVTRKIVEDGEPARFAERHEPENANDSGWRFASGSESEDYMADDDNVVAVVLGDLARRHPAMGKNAMLGAPVGSLYRLDGDRYVPDDGPPAGPRA